MKSQHALWMIIIVTLVAGGVFIGRRLLADIPFGEPERQTEDAAFREWLWERRPLDLLTQVGLIFAGALGVAAILPGNEEIPPPQPDLNDAPKESP